MPIATEPIGAAVNGVLYVIGGNANGFCTSVVQAYDPSTNSWRLVSRMPTPRCHLAAAVENGLIYVIGGTDTSGSIHYQTMEVYDPATNSWFTAAEMLTGRCLLAATVLNSKLYALGGSNPETPREAISTSLPNSKIYGPGRGSATGTLATVEVYDPSTEKWTSGIPMPTARTGLTAAVVGSILYTVGGNGTTNFLTTNEAFHIRSIRRRKPSAK